MTYKTGKNYVLTLQPQAEVPHTTFTDSYTFPFSFSKFWAMHPYTAVHSFKNWTIPNDPRSLVPLDIFLSEL